MTRNKTILTGLVRGLVMACAFAVTSVAVASTAIYPDYAYLRASRPCTITGTYAMSSVKYKISNLVDSGDEGSWYGYEELVFIKTNSVRFGENKFVAKLTGYTTEWRSPANAFSLHNVGPLSVTNRLTTSDTLTLSSTLVHSLIGSSEFSGKATILYAVFTPITYSVEYNLAGGELEEGVSNPTDATYDEPFAVSSPKRTGYKFCGWNVNGKIYFDGEGRDVTLKNLTSVAGEKVKVTATWEPRQYNLELIVNEGVDKIYYRIGTNDWQTVNASITLLVDYDAEWAAYAEPAYGYEASSGTGWSKKSPESDKMGLDGATFEPEPKLRSFELKLKADPTDGGSVSGSGSYPYKTQVELTAKASEGHKFMDWSDGSTENPHNVTVLSDTNIVARFKTLSYSLSLNFPKEGIEKIYYKLGETDEYTEITETRKIPVLYGTKYYAYAVTPYGYELYGIGSSLDNLYEGTMGTAGAAFSPSPTKCRYELKLMVNMSEGGYASGGGRYEYLDKAYLTVNANSGYRFVGWSDGSTENPYWYSVTSNMTLTANFCEKTYGLQLIVDEGVAKIYYQLATGDDRWPEEWQETDVSKTVDVVYGTRYRAYAEAKTGYELTGSGSTVGSAVTGTVRMDGAVFEPKPTAVSCRVNLSATPSAGGSVSGSGVYGYNENATITATPAKGYHFESWSDGSAENPHKIQVLAATNLVAQFAADTYALQLIVDEGVAKIYYETDSATNSTPFSMTLYIEYGSFYRVWADAASGYELTGSGSSKGSAVTGTMTTLGYVFEPKPDTIRCRVELSASPVAGGSVSGSGTYAYGETVLLTATPSTGYHFDSWSDGSTENPHQVQILAATNIIARFAIESYPLRLVVGDGIAKIHYKTATETKAVTDSTTISLEYGSTYCVWADAKPGYDFTGSGSSEGSPVTGTMTTLGYVFEPKATIKKYLVTVSSSPTEAGTVKVNGDGYFEYGARAKVEANANKGWYFSCWNDVTAATAIKQSESPIYDFTVTNSVFFEAVFVQEKYTVTFKYRNENGDWISDYQKVAFGESAIEPAAEKRNNWPGHVFLQWDSSDWQSVEGDMEITAQYSDGGYTVHFNANGGTGKMADQTFTYGKEQALRANTFVAPSGYTFAGWAKTIDTTSQSRQYDYADQEVVQNLTTSDSITLYAVWVPKTYTIRYEPGNSDYGAAYEETDIEYDAPHRLMNCTFESTKCDFRSWKDKETGNTYTNCEIVTRLSTSGKVTLTAQWSGSYTVKFHANYDGAETVISPTSYDQAFSSDVENALRANTFMRTGYTFAGWSTTSEGDVKYDDQALFPDPNDDIDAGETVNLYAVWKPNTYQVVFDPGEGKDIQRKMFPCILSYDSPTNVIHLFDPPDKTRPFVGWSTSTNVSDLITGTSFITGKVITDSVYGPIKNLTAIPGDHIRLYAIWKSDAKKQSSVKLTTSAARTVSAQSKGEDALATKTVSAQNVDAESLPRQTAATTPSVTWNYTGWTDLGSGVYSNGAASATLSTNITTSGTLTFDWMPSAQGDIKCGSGRDAPTIKESERLSNTVLSVKLAESCLTNLTGVTTRNWQSVTVEVNDVSSPTKLSLVSDASYIKGGTTYKGVYPCMISNIVWTPYKEDPGEGGSTAKPISVNFEIVGDDQSKGNFSDGDYTETISTTVYTNASGTVTNGATIKVPSVNVIDADNYAFNGWTNSLGRKIDVSTESTVVSNDTTFIAQFEAKSSPTDPTVPTNELVKLDFVINPEQGKHIGGGMTNTQFEIRIYKDTAMDVITNNVGALEPTVVGVNGWDFVEWKVVVASDSERGKDSASTEIIAIDDICNQPITADTTFVACFKPHVYSVIYANVKGAVNPMANPRYFTAANGSLCTNDAYAVAQKWDGSLARLMTADSTENLAFVNWMPTNVAAATYMQYAPNGTYLGYVNPVVQAQWNSMVIETNPIYTVTFVSGEDYAPTRTNLYVEAGKSVIDVPTAAPKRGYAFTGWDKSLDNVKANLEVNALYGTLISYAVTYKNLKGATHDNPSEYTIKSGGLKFNEPQNGNDNIKFLGWSILAEDGSVYTNSIPSNVVSALTVSANWAYRVTFKRSDADHVKFVGEDNRSLKLYVQENIGVTNVSVSVDAGYSFVGWYDEKGELVELPVDATSSKGEDALATEGDAGRVANVDASTMTFIVSNVTAAATYTALATANVYTVTFDKGVGDGVEVSGEMVDQSFTYDVYQALSLNKFARVDAKFVGWRKDVASTEYQTDALYADGEAVKNLATGGVVTLTAQWSMKTNTVTCVLGEHLSTTEPLEQEVEYGGSVTLPAVTADYGYSFAGWSKGEDALATEGDAGRVANVDALATEGDFIVSNVTESVTYVAWATATVYSVTLDGVVTNVSYGESVTLSTPASVTNGLTNVVCVGWVGCGSVPASGTGNSVTFAVTNASALAWCYATNYWVEAKTKGEGGSVALYYDDGGHGVTALPAGSLGENPGWYREGTNLVAVATPAEGWLFAGWSKGEDALATEGDAGRVANVDALATEGDAGRVANVAASTLAFTVSNTVSLVASFTQSVHSVVIDGVVTNVSYGESVTLSTPASVTNGLTNVVCVGWVGSGSVPASGTGNSVTFAVTNASELAWCYATNYWVEAKGQGEGGSVALYYDDGGHGVTALPAGSLGENPGWYREGTNLVAVSTISNGWSFAGWSKGEDALATEGDAGRVANVDALATLALTISGPIELTATITANVYKISYELPEGVTNAVVNPSTYTVTNAITFAAPTGKPTDPEVGPFAGWSPAEIAKGSTGDVSVISLWGKMYWVEVKAKGEGGGEGVAETKGGSVALYYDDGGHGVTALPAGSPLKNPGWYIEGTNLVAVATPAEGWLFAGWSKGEDALATEGDAGRVANVAASTLAFTVSNTVSLVASFTQSVHSVVIDGVVTNVSYGESVTLSTPASVTNGLTNVVCVGWVGSGSVPASGTGNSVTFAVTNASALAWCYATNYWVEAKGQGEGGSVALYYDDGGHGVTALPAGSLGENPGWYREGTNLVAVATPAEGWLFAGWSKGEDALATEGDAGRVANVDALATEGDDAGRVANVDALATLAFTVSGATELTATFTQKQYTVTFVLDEHLTRTGGDDLEQAVLHGESPVEPTVAGVGYWTLEGWYVEVASETGGVTWKRVDVASLSVTDDLTIYAQSADNSPYIEANLASEYPRNVLIDPIPVRCVHEEGATLAVSGLPTGLKFTTKMVTTKKTKTVKGKTVVISVTTNAPAKSIYGTPTKSGIYSVTLKATLSKKSGKKTVTTTVASTNVSVVVRVSGEYTLRASCDSVCGKVTGTGVYAAGKSVTLKATANKGYVFSGWYAAKAEGSSRLSALASYAIKMPEEDVAYVAKFITVAEDKAAVNAGINGMPVIASGVSTGTATNISAGVYLEWPLVAAGDSTVTVAVSGLPTGLKFTAKPVITKTTKKVNGQTVVVSVTTNVPANTIYGTPTVGGKTSKVNLTVTTAGKSKVTGVLSLTVEALPSWLVATYVGGNDGDEPGSATLTVAKTGKISGKWISKGLTWTLSAANFDTTYTAVVTAKNGKQSETLKLVFSSETINGAAVGVVAAGWSEGEDALATENLLFSAIGANWKTAPWKTKATALKNKTFVVERDDSAIKLTGKVGANGVVSVAGVFVVDATTYRVIAEDAEEYISTKTYKATVSATLEPIDDDLYELFVYYPPKAKKFAGYATWLTLRFADGSLQPTE